MHAHYFPITVRTNARLFVHCMRCVRTADVKFIFANVKGKTLEPFACRSWISGDSRAYLAA